MKKNLLLIVLLMTLIPLAGYSQNETSTQFTVAGGGVGGNRGA